MNSLFTKRSHVSIVCSLYSKIFVEIMTQLITMRTNNERTLVSAEFSGKFYNFWAAYFQIERSKILIMNFTMIASFQY